MKKNLLWVAGVAILMASCNNESENIVPVKPEGRVAMTVKTNVMKSRAMITGTSLADGDEIGVTLVEMPEIGQAHGATYDGLGVDDGYWNVKYYATGDGDEQTWTSDAPIMLSSTLGQAVAYYPYAGTQNDYKALEITSEGQTDYLYSGWEDADGINNAAPTTTFVMKHALSAVRLTLKRGSYTYTGEVTAASISSEGFGVEGSLDASTGEITGVTGNAAVTTAMNNDFTALTIPTLTTESVNTLLMVVPVQGVAVDAVNGLGMDIEVTIDGKQYTLTGKMTEEFKSGYIYNFELTLNNTALKVTKVSVTPWEEETAVGGDLNPA